MIGNARLAACVAEAYPPTKAQRPKLTDLQVTVIAGANRRGATHAQLGKMYGVSSSTIHRSLTKRLKQTTEAPAHAGAFVLPKENT